MSGGGAGDPRDDPDETKSEVIDCSYQNHAKAISEKVGIVGRRSVVQYWMKPI